MLPSWITAVKATPGSPQPKMTGTTLTWAVLLMGKNSVKPWTRPITTACQRVMVGPSTANKGGRGGIEAP
jgi:hypothetical protein